ncbi:hypothetical protein HNP86_001784 [Methanococcus maripaludis]|uniref:Uncharacterized protein n=1 Tax=Methanococcus maripaludis TaxID=39152 RepID=A0A7J9NWI9_METMI|nr:hypothetical protein [Methanococcus maripaludis]MBA2851625.1 hypothetical protein [Methanococcus maripaludis]
MFVVVCVDSGASIYSQLVDGCSDIETAEYILETHRKIIVEQLEEDGLTEDEINKKLVTTGQHIMFDGVLPDGTHRYIMAFIQELK